MSRGDASECSSIPFYGVWSMVFVMFESFVWASLFPLLCTSTLGSLWSSGPGYLAGLRAMSFRARRGSTVMPVRVLFG